MPFEAITVYLYGGLLILDIYGLSGSSSCVIFYQIALKYNNLYYISDFIYTHRRVLACNCKKRLAILS